MSKPVLHLSCSSLSLLLSLLLLLLLFLLLYWLSLMCYVSIIITLCVDCYSLCALLIDVACVLVIIVHLRVVRGDNYICVCVCVCVYAIITCITCMSCMHNYYHVCFVY